MSIPVIYANTQYIAGKHLFKTIPEGISTTLNSLTNVPTCNVMTLVGANVGIGTTVPRQYLDVQGGNTIVSGRIGIATTSPLVSLHVVGQSYLSANVGIGTTAPRQYLDIQGGNAIISGTIGVGTTVPRALLDIQGGNAIISGNIGIGTTVPRALLDIQGGNAIIFGNVGIGSTNPDVRLLVGENTTRDEFIKVNSQGYAGLILNGDTTNAAGEPGGAYVELRIDSSSQRGVFAINQIDGQDGRGNTLTSSIANGILLHHTGNYPIQFATGSTVKMTLTSAGDLGIGTTNPTYKLHVNGSALVDSTMYVGGAADVNEVQADDGDAGDPSYTFRSDTDTGMYRSTTNTIGFSAGGTERVLINTSGLRTYGQSTWYNTSLEYQGVIEATTNLKIEAQRYLYLEATEFYVRSMTAYNTTTSGGANMNISAAGTIQRSTSSIRYKKDIITMEDSIADNILQCRPIKYKAINPREAPINWTYYGFIAEEVALIEPRLVTYDQNNQPDGVQYDRFVPLLLNLIKRQKEEINTLRSDYNSLIQTLTSKGILT